MIILTIVALNINLNTQLNIPDFINNHNFNDFIEFLGRYDYLEDYTLISDCRCISYNYTEIDVELAKYNTCLCIKTYNDIGIII